MAAAVVYSYAVYVRLPLTRPTPVDYSDAAAYIRQRWQPGDLIDAAPFWATRVRQHLGDLPLRAFRDLALEDLTRYRRVWLFSSFGAERRPRVQAAMNARADLVDERQFGRINVRLYVVRGHEPVLYDFRDALHAARVRIQRGDLTHDCPAGERGRWRCSTQDWNYVGREIIEMAGEPRAVIWAHPVSESVLTIEFEGVPFGRALTLGAGFSRVAAAYGGAPVELTVEAGGRELLRRSFDARSGFARERVETPQLAGGLQHVAFRIRTMDDRVRHFCFSAEVRG